MPTQGVESVPANLASEFRSSVLPQSSCRPQRPLSTVVSSVSWSTIQCVNSYWELTICKLLVQNRKLFQRVHACASRALYIRDSQAETLHPFMATTSLGHSRRLPIRWSIWGGIWVGKNVIQTLFFTRNPSISEALEDVPSKTGTTLKIGKAVPNLFSLN